MPLSETDWTVPLKSFSGFFASGVNAYNGSKQYNYAAKHNPMVFFDDTNGGNNTTTSNPLRTSTRPCSSWLPIWPVTTWLITTG